MLKILCVITTFFAILNTYYLSSYQLLVIYTYFLIKVLFCGLVW